MTERLIVKGFAGIEHVELDIGRINILIGPQAAGKSICAKLLFYFKSFFDVMGAAVYYNDSREDFEKRMIDKFERYFPPSSWSQPAFLVRYEVGDTFIQIEKSEKQNNILTLQYSEYYKEKYQEFASFFQKEAGNYGSDQALRMGASFNNYQKITSRIHNDIGVTTGNQQFFIPSGRSFFAIFQSSIFSILSRNQVLDPFLVEFGSSYEQFKAIPEHLKSELRKQNRFSKHIDELNELILYGKIQRENNKDILIQEDGRRIYLENASSGQQEMFPLSVMLSFLSLFNVSDIGNTVYIEEPEAHLFPTAQRHIVEMIATVFNAKPNHLQFVITTHSPYILTSFNNLMHAGFLAKTLRGEKSKQLNKIVPEQYQLQPDYVKSYAIKGGTQQNLVCPDSGLILGDIIDEVSNDLSVQFGDLLEVE